MTTGPPTGPTPAAAAGRAAQPLAAVRAFRRRHRLPITIVGSLLAIAVLGRVLAGRREDFVTALQSAPLAVLVVAAALQVVALLARSEAWHRCVDAAGGTIDRRILFRASSMQVLGSVLNGQLGVAARIAALRTSSPSDCPRVPTLIAAELPILAVEAVLAALASFTLVGPLGLPWWLPVVCLVAMAALSAGLRRLALRTGHRVWEGLAVLRSLHGGGRLIGLVLIAVSAQILRNWLLLDAVGVDASLFDATAVLIAMVVLSLLPLGPASGAAAAVLILGRDGVAAVAAAGVLTTVTGTVGGLAFVAWAALDRLLARSHRSGSTPPVTSPSRREPTTRRGGGGPVGHHQTITTAAAVQKTVAVSPAPMAPGSTMSVNE